MAPPGWPFPHAPAFAWTTGGTWSMDLGSLPAFNNQPAVYLKWTLSVPAGDAHCFRIDNLQLSAGAADPPRQHDRRRPHRQHLAQRPGQAQR